MKLYLARGAAVSAALQVLILNLVPLLTHSQGVVSNKPVMDLDTNSPNSTSTTVTFQEQEGRVRLLQGTSHSLTDPNSVTLSQATLTLLNRPNEFNEFLELDETTGVIVVVHSDFASDASTGTLSLFGNFLPGLFLDVLREVYYVNHAFVTHEDETRTVQIVITDDTGLESEPVYVELFVEPYNDPPVVSLGGLGMMDYTANFTEEGPCVPIASPQVQVGDPDSVGITSVLVSLQPAAADILLESVMVPTNIPGTAYSASPAELLLVLHDTSFTAYQQVLSQVVYCNAADNPDSAPRTVTVVVTDVGLITFGGASSLPPASSEPAHTIVEIVPTNDAPSLLVEPALVTGGSASTAFLLKGSANLSDVDSTRFSQIRVTISNAPDGPSNEVIEVQQVSTGDSLVGPAVDGDTYIYTYTFDEGATSEQVSETLDNIRYRNIEANITATAIRRICVQVSDGELFSNQACVDLNVEQSSTNTFAPMFSQSLYSFTINEENLPISVGHIDAVDSDTGRSGLVAYAATSDTSGLVQVNSSTGEITAPLGLDAELISSLILAVTATDLGNPPFNDSAFVIVNVVDVNDNAPQFIFPTEAPTYSLSITEGTNAFITIVNATDVDATSPNNLIEYSLLGDGFAINSATGDIVALDALDAELQEEYILTVTATDGGGPKLSATAIVTVTILDVNDNPTVPHLPSPYYLLQHETTAQPLVAAAQLFDFDLSESGIQEVNVTITPTVERPYNICLQTCQEARLLAAGLTSGTTLINQVNYFEGSTTVSDSEVVIGDGNCSAIHLSRGAAVDGSQDVYGRIPNTSLPTNFGSGAYSISFVANIREEGFIFIAIDTDDPLEQPNVELSLQVLPTSIVFQYLHGSTREAGTFQYNLSSNDPFSELFSPSEGTTRHYVLVVHSNPIPSLDIYLDCSLLVSSPLTGPVQAPDLRYGLFLGQSTPNPLTNGGRFDGDIHGLHYHPFALSDTQVADFCLCGSEYLTVPAVVSGTLSTVSPDGQQVSIRSATDLAALTLSDAVRAMRQVQYTNSFPYTGQPRNLELNVADIDGLTFTSTSQIIFSSQETSPRPVLDLNGLDGAGEDANVTFTEAEGPVPIVPNGADLSWVGLDGSTPTFSEVVVDLLEALDLEETIAGNGSEYITVESVNRTSLRLVGPGLAAEFLEALQSLRYVNTNPLLVPVPRRVSFTVYDIYGGMSNPPVHTDIAVVAVNQPPIIGGVPPSIAYTEGSSVVVTPGLTFEDFDSVNVSMAMVEITSPTSDALEILGSHPTVAITSSLQTLVVSGEASISTYQSVLRSVHYSSNANPPVTDTPASRSISISLIDAEGAQSSVEIPIVFHPVNDRPVVIVEPSALYFNGSGQPPQPVVSTVSISDPDSVMWHSMTVTLDGAVDGDALTDGVTTSRVLIYGDIDALETYVAILQDIVYDNPQYTPTPVSRRVTVEVCDIQDCGSTFVTILVDPLVCRSNSCLNNGLCVEGPALQFSCVCGSRFTGEFCETVIPVSLLSFNFDLNTGQLSLLFQFPVNTSTLNASAISIQDSSLANSIVRLAGVLTVEEGLVLRHNLTLLDSDLNALKADEGLATTREDTYISLREGAYLGALGYPVTGIPDGAALPAVLYTPDSTPPSLLSFDLLVLPQGGAKLALMFSEPVNPATLDFRGLVLLSAPSSNIRYQLTGGNVSVHITTLIELTLTTSDVTTIRESYYPLGASPNSTYLSANSSSITDTVGNFLMPISYDMPLRVESITADLVPPAVDAFSLDMDDGVLSITFSEEIEPSTLNLNLISLHDATGEVGLVSSSAVTTAGPSLFVDILLSGIDLDTLKIIPRLATTPNDTFLTVEAGYVTDTSGNIARERVVALPVQEFEYDVTNPVVQSFSFDLDAGEMMLNFSEPVNQSSIATDQLVLFTGRDNTPIFSPSTSNLSSLASRVIGIALSFGDLNEIKWLQICLTEVDCNLHFPRVPGEVTGTDFAGNSLVSVPESTPLPVDNFIADTTPPELSLFRMDLDSGTIGLSFLETIAFSSLDPTQITLQNRGENPSISLVLAGGDPNDTTRGESLQVTMTLDDLNLIKSSADLCNDFYNCYIAVTPSLVNDISGNPVQATDALLADADTFIVDSSGPFLVAFDFDLTAATITFNFDEVVDTATFQPTLVSLLNSANPTVSYNLTDGTLLSTEIDTSILLALTELDTISIQANTELATSQGDTFISFPSGIVQDTSGNPSATSPVMQVTTYTEDSIAPLVVAVNLLDMNTGTLSLTLNEPVRDLVDASAITICSFSTCSLNHTLTAGISTYTDIVTKTGIALELSMADLVAVKSLSPNIATSGQDSHIALEVGAIQDTAGNDNVPVSPDAAQQVLDYVPDTTRPSLLDFTLDLNNGQLNLIFDDVISSNSLDPTAITVQSGPILSEAASYLQLTGGTVLTGNGLALVVQLATLDYDAIISELTLATATSNTYITITDGAASDVAGNNLIPVSGLQAGMLILDNPLLLGFEFDLNTGTLTLLFSEAIDLVSINISTITLLNMPLGTHSHRLTGGIVQTTEISNRTVVELFAHDLNDIKANPQLATSASNTYISATEATAADMLGNVLVPVPSFLAIQVSTLTADETPPEVLSFDLLPGSVVLAVNFSETINASSVDPTGFTILLPPSTAVTLTGGTVATQNSPRIEVTLTDDDIESIRDSYPLATSPGSTFLGIAPTAAADMSWNSVAPPDDPIPASTITADFLPPELAHSTLDLNLGALTLVFSEGISLDSVNVSKLMLRNAHSDPVSTVALADSIVRGINSTTVVVELSKTILDTMKVSGIGASVRDAYVTVSLAAVKDTLGNLIQPTTMQISQLLPDMTSPSLTNFTIDLNEGQMVIFFDEPVQLSSLTLTDIILTRSVDTTAPSTTAVTLTTSSTSLWNAKSILVEFSTDELNELKYVEICLEAPSCYLHTSPNATLVDYFNQPLRPIPPSEALLVSAYSYDVTRPTLLSFASLDLDSGTLKLYYSETVNATSFSVRELMLQSSPEMSLGSSYTLTGGTASLQSPTVLTVVLSNADLNAVKADGLLCASESTCYVQFDASLVADLSGNLVVPPEQASILRYLEFDSTPPEMLSFDLDMNVGLMTLYFDETVNSATFRPGEIIVQNSPSATASVQLSRDTGFDSSIRSDTLSFNILAGDVMRLQMTDMLATETDNTFLVFSANLISDTSGTRVRPVIDSNPLPIGIYTPDTTRPELLHFSLLDMDQGLIELEFSEPVVSSAVDIGAISLCSTANCSVSISLFDSSIVTSDVQQPQQSLQITLSEQDLRDIKRQYPNIASSPETAWISLQSGSITDAVGNPVLPSIAKVDSYQLDHTRPNLLRFELDVNTGGLVLEFDDVIDTTSSMANLLRIQRSFGPSLFVLLSSETQPPEDQAPMDDTLELVLGPTDLRNLRLQAPGLATSIDNTYISITVADGAFVDVFGNEMNSILQISALQASEVTPFSLDCENGGVFVPGMLDCECVEGFSGTLCKTDLDFCQILSPCSNGGTCIEGLGAQVSCSCTEDYAGETCDFRIGIVICPSEADVPLYPGSSFVYSWNETEVGQSLARECPSECSDLVEYTDDAVLVRRCVEGEGDVGEWMTVDLTGCQLSKTGLDLCEAGLQAGNSSVVEVSGIVVNITNNASEVDAAAVSVASNIVEDLTEDAINDEEVRMNYLEIIDNLISADRETLVESEQESSSSSRILDSLDTFTSRVVINSSDTDGAVFAQEYFAILVDEVDPNEFTGEAFSAVLGDVDQVGTIEDIDSDDLVRSNETLADATASVDVPASIYDGSENDSQRLSYSVFLLDSLFLTNETDCEAFAIASVILSVNTNATTANLTEGVLLTFQRLEQVCNGMTSSESQVQCANFEMGEAGQTGRWSTDNCQKITDSGGRTTCKCQQLGHFGLLFDLSPGDSVSPIALAVISYVGAILSTICLAIIVATYLYSKKLRGMVHGQLLVQLSLALIGLYITFLIAGHVTSVSELCATVASLLHYFVLVFFGWTAVEAIHLYRKLVTVLGSEIKKYTLKAALVVWLAPVIVVVVAAGAGNEYYSNPYYCRPTGYPFYFALILPFCVIYVFDWVMFVIIMASLFVRASRSAKITTKEKGSAENVKRFTLIAIGLSVVFGLGWGLGLAASSSDVEEVTFVFQVLFSIFVGSQGILIFILHGLRSPDVRTTWKTWFSFLPCLRKAKKYDLSHSTSRGTGTMGSRQTDSSYHMSTLRRTSQSSSSSLPRFAQRETPMSELSSTAIPEVDEAGLENAPPDVQPGEEHLSPLEGRVIENTDAVIDISKEDGSEGHSRLDGAQTGVNSPEPTESGPKSTTGEDTAIVVENLGAQDDQPLPTGAGTTTAGVGVSGSVTMEQTLL